MSKRKFDIGDRVVISKKYKEKYNCINCTGIITSIDSCRTCSRYKYTVEWSDKSFLDKYYSYELEKEEMKFKKGDKVIFTPEAKQWIRENGYWGHGRHGRKTGISPIDPNKVYTISFVFNTFKRYDLEGVTGVEITDEDLLPAVDSKLKEKWTDICNEYLREFCEKHGYRYEPDMWIGGDPGTIIEVSDMFISINDIRYDIDHNIPEENFSKWYWKRQDIYELTDGAENYMNYENFCKGCPDYWTEERMESIREAKLKIKKAYNDLEERIKDVRNNSVSGRPLGGF